MLTLGITGGVASGKSTLARFLAAALGDAPLFDADACVRSLLSDDPDVRGDVTHLFGPAAYAADGAPDRTLIRSLAFASPENRRALERILHPRVRAAWTTERLRWIETGACNFFLVEIPLLYETGADRVVDRVIVAGCRVETQLRRLVKIRHVPEPIARAILASQLDPAEKIRRCDHVAWNESSPQHLLEQARILARHLLHA